MAKIMIVFSNLELGTVLEFRLKKEKHIVKLVTSSEKALSLMKKDKSDIILADIDQPGIDGYELTKRLRQIENNHRFYIILISKDDKLQTERSVYEAGADDYLLLPTRMESLVFKIQAHINAHPRIENDTGFIVGPFRIEVNSDRLYYQDNIIDLTPTETEIMYYLMQNPNLAKKDDIISLISTRAGLQKFITIRSLDVHITNIRNKIGDEGTRLIETVWGKGYRLVYGEPEEE